MEVGEFVVLRGKDRGKHLLLEEPSTLIGFSEQCQVRLDDLVANGQQEPVIAQVRVDDGHHLLEVQDRSLPVLLNKSKVEQTMPLAPGDVLGFGPDVETFEFHLVHEPARSRRIWARLGHALRHSLTDPETRSKMLVTALGVTVLAGLIWFVITQIKLSNALQDLSGQVQRQQQSLADLNQKIEQLHLEIKTTKQAVEGGDTWIGRLSTTYSQSVCLIEAGYRFVERGTGRVLREAQAGESAITVGWGEEQYQVTVEGTGPAFEQISIGTGFLVQPGLILTNLHVARPWWKDGIAEQLMGQGFQARMLRLNAYFPTARRPFRLEPAGDNATHDLALCRFLPGDLSVPPPPLAASDAPLNVGQTIVLLSYPAGIDALLGRLDEAVAQDVVNTTPSSRVTDVLRELATRGLIRPLPTQGHITALWPTRIVHDAPVASGSSGGPLLNREGVVVGISFAMVPEFGGSNYAIPINAVREFLRQQGVIP